METFSALLALCSGNSSVTGEFPTQRPVTRSFDILFDLHLHKRMSKQSWGWWFETPSCPLWRHGNVNLRTSQEWIAKTFHKCEKRHPFKFYAWNTCTPTAKGCILYSTKFRIPRSASHCPKYCCLGELDASVITSISVKQCLWKPKHIWKCVQY